MKRNILKFCVVDLNKIKTTYYQQGITPEVSKELSNFTKTIFPLEHIVVHGGTMELIANGHYYDAYKQTGVKTVKVVVANFPKEELIHAVYLHWKPVQSFAKLFPIMLMLLVYYSKRSKGPGSKYRMVRDGETLRAYIAELCGTNRTYFDYILKVGQYKPKLLAGVDAGEFSLLDAVRMVPKKDSAGKKGGKKHAEGIIPMNQDIHISSIKSLSPDERRLLCNALPKVLSDKLNAGVLPDGLELEKRLSYNKELLNFHLNYELNNTQVSADVIPMPGHAVAKAA